MTNGAPTAPGAAAGGPRQAPLSSAQTEAGKEKKDLASWWRTFKKTDKKTSDTEPTTQGIFGVPLQTSIRYANVAISLFNDEGQSYIYGYVPIVVAKCGVFLKEKATDVEGIFRLAGSEKRIKELKLAFDSPDRYGKGLDWTGYTVHDAANILRRYFNQLPEPIIPLDFYQKFRDPLRNHQHQAVGTTEIAPNPGQGEFDIDSCIREYQKLITELPPLNRQLLLYILDLLAVFASKSDMNKMTTPNLAAIFQPGILNHPQHDMAPAEYRLSQDVLIFLIENQDSFLIGMQGTAADEKTVRDVQSGSPTRPPSTPTTPNRSKTVIDRSSSNSSVAAESVRKWGSIRRNASVSSSKGSKRSEGPTNPATPTLLSSGSVHRSNTVPSKRNGSAAQSPRLARDKGSDASTPTPGTPNAPTGTAEANNALRPSSLQSTPVAAAGPVFPVAAPEVISASSSEATTPLATFGSDASSAVTRDSQTPKRDTTPLLAPPSGSTERSSDRSLSNTPNTPSERKFFNILKQSPGSDGETRKPNKLQKKRIPGSTLSSAHSSSHSLPETSEDSVPQRSPRSPKVAPSTTVDGTFATLGPAPTSVVASTPPTVPQRNPTDATLKPSISPSPSFNSHTDVSDADLVGDDLPAPTGEAGQEGRKQRRWRLSRPTNKYEPHASAGNTLGTINAQEHSVSRTTIGSTASQPRRSFQEPSGATATNADPAFATHASPPPTHSMYSSSTDPLFSDSEKEKKGLFSRIRDKIRENKDHRDNERSARSTERGHERSKSRQDLSYSSMESAPPGRGRAATTDPSTASSAPHGGAAVVPTTVAAPPIATATAASPATASAQPATSVPLEEKSTLVEQTAVPNGIAEKQEVSAVPETAGDRAE